MTFLIFQYFVKTFYLAIIIYDYISLSNARRKFRKIAPLIHKKRHKPFFYHSHRSSFLTFIVLNVFLLIILPIIIILLTDQVIIAQKYYKHGNYNIIFYFLCACYIVYAFKFMLFLLNYTKFILNLTR